MNIGDTRTLDLLAGDDLPAWREPTCQTRWAGLTIPNGATVTIYDRAAYMDSEDTGAQWWKVSYVMPDVPKTIFALAEAHDHLGQF